MYAVPSGNHDAAVNGARTGDPAGKKRGEGRHVPGPELVQLQERLRRQGKPVFIFSSLPTMGVDVLFHVFFVKVVAGARIGPTSETASVEERSTFSTNAHKCTAQYNTSGTICLATNASVPVRLG